jgi:hypothetical protein
MTRKLTAAMLVALAIAGATSASAQTLNDYLRYQWTGTGQCTSWDGFGKYTPCDSGAGN